MLYASYGTGYKSGGTNADRIPAGFDYIFGAETSESFEVGMKTVFPVIPEVDLSPTLSR